MRKRKKKKRRERGVSCPTMIESHSACIVYSSMQLKSVVRGFLKLSRFLAKGRRTAILSEALRSEVGHAASPIRVTFVLGFREKVLAVGVTWISCLFFLDQKSGQG